MPNKEIDARWETAKPQLIEAANAAGIDVEIMVKISGFESGFNPAARPISRDETRNNTTQFDGVKAISSAHGYGQFLNGTWHDMINKYGEKYGVENAGNLSKAEANSAELRNDVGLQAAILAEFTKENIRKGAKLGGVDADANVYAFHNLGDGDSTSFLKAMNVNPNQRADQVLSATVIRGNPALYGDGSRSLTDSYKAMGQQMDNYEKYALDATQGISKSKTSADTIYTQQIELGNVQNSLYPHLGNIYFKNIQTVEPKINISTMGRGVNTSRANDEQLGFGIIFDEKNRPKQSGVSGQHRSAMSDGILKQGESGTAIAVLQTQLNTLGFKDAQGKALAPDGDFGDRTKQAIQAFQRAHHLEDDGVIGKATFAALRNTQAAVEIPSPSLAIDKKETPLLSNPNHPDHALYKQALSGMEKLPATAFKSDLERQNAAATVVFEAKVSGISRIDNVALSTNGNGLFAVQGGMNDPAHHRIYVDKAQAAAQPIEKSTQQLHQENLQQAQPVQVPEQQKRAMTV